MGGPIWKDHLFAYGSVNLFYQDENDRTTSPGPLPDSNFDIQEYFLKLSATPVPTSSSTPRSATAASTRTTLDIDFDSDAPRRARRPRSSTASACFNWYWTATPNLQRRFQVQLQRQPAELGPDHPDPVSAALRPGQPGARRLLLQLRDRSVRRRREPRATTSTTSSAYEYRLTTSLPDELPRRQPPDQAGRQLQRQQGREDHPRQRLGLDHRQLQRGQLPRGRILLSRPLQPQPAGADFARPHDRRLPAGPGDLGPVHAQPRRPREPGHVHPERQRHVRLRPGRLHGPELRPPPLHGSEPRPAGVHVPRHVHVPLLQTVAAARRHRLRGHAERPRQGVLQLRALRQHGQPVVRPLGGAPAALPDRRLLRPHDRRASSGDHALEQRRQGRAPATSTRRSPTSSSLGYARPFANGWVAEIYGMYRKTQRRLRGLPGHRHP